MKTHNQFALTLLQSMAVVAIIFGTYAARAEETAPVLPAPEVPAPVATVPAPEAVAPAKDAPAAPIAEAQEKAEMAMCPMCSAAGDKVEMPASMKQHCEMLTNAELSQDDAVCLLAIKKELALTPEQTQQLDQIIKVGREKAAALLTPEQKAMLVVKSGQPMTMGAVHKMMHAPAMANSEDEPKSIVNKKAMKKPKAEASVPLSKKKVIQKAEEVAPPVK